MLKCLFLFYLVEKLKAELKKLRKEVGILTECHVTEMARSDRRERDLKRKREVESVLDARKRARHR